jgi:hypothetical protein
MARISVLAAPDTKNTASPGTTQAASNIFGLENAQKAFTGEYNGLLDPRVFKVNLIPYNPTGMYDGSSPEAIAAFKNVLGRARIPVTVRLTRGRDIAAACGQLAVTSGAG